MSDYGMKVSQPGYDVKTAPKERLVISSKYDTLKVFMSGSGSIAVAAAPAPYGYSLEIVTIAHNLGYKPAFFAFSDSILSGSDKFAPYNWANVGGAPSQQAYAVDTSNLYLYFRNPFTAFTFHYRYFIYYNELA